MGKLRLEQLTSMVLLGSLSIHFSAGLKQGNRYMSKSTLAISSAIFGLAILLTGNSAYGQVTIVGGRAYTTSFAGYIFALDADKAGQILW